MKRRVFHTCASCLLPMRGTTIRRTCSARCARRLAVEVGRDNASASMREAIRRYWLKKAAA